MAQAGMTVQLAIPEIYQVLKCPGCAVKDPAKKCPITKKFPNFTCPQLVLRRLIREKISDEMVNQMLGLKEK